MQNAEANAKNENKNCRLFNVCFGYFGNVRQ